MKEKTVRLKVIKKKKEIGFLTVDWPFLGNGIVFPYLNKRGKVKDVTLKYDYKQTWVSDDTFMVEVTLNADGVDNDKLAKVLK